MAKNDVDKVTDEKIRSGGILARLYFDVQDRDRERLQPLLVDLINNRLLKEQGVVYCYGKINDPIKSGDLFVTSAVVTSLFESMSSMVMAVFHFAPVGIELLRPEKEYSVKTAELQSVMLDLSAISVSYSKYMLERILDPKEKEVIKRQLQNRAELGKRQISESKKEGEGSSEGDQDEKA